MKSIIFFFVTFFSLGSRGAYAFMVPVCQSISMVSDVSLSPIVMSSGGSGDDENESARISLEDKMKNWEATEDEMKEATLGGVIPSGNRSDSFDVGLYILFPFMVLSGFAFAFFPLIMDKIDVTSVGPPPTM